MLTRVLTAAFIASLASAIAHGQQRAPAGDLKIVVIAGEGAVNIIQQKTAVAPIIEVRDRNNLPVSGVSVTFSVSGSGATFGSGSTLTAITNAAGQATAAGLTPTAAGAVQVNVSAAFQGQMATAAITQTNFATAAQAAAAAGSTGGATGGSAAGGGGGASSGGAAGGAAGGAGGGIGATTLVVVGAAVAGGAVVAATQTDLFGEKGFIVISGLVYARAIFGQAPTCPPGGVLITIGTGATCYLEPLAGATVSTTLDSATATTDGAGNFDLTTTLPRSRIDECLAYTITITAAGLPTYTVNTRGFSGNQSAGSQSRQTFSVSPPSPTSMGGC
jgi:hypothetical protein